MIAIIFLFLLILGTKHFECIVSFNPPATLWGSYFLIPVSWKKPLRLSKARQFAQVTQRSGEAKFVSLLLSVGVCVRAGWGGGNSKNDSRQDHAQCLGQARAGGQQRSGCGCGKF